MLPGGRKQTMSTYSKGEPPRINSGSELTKAQEEIERLQSGIAALRADLINRRNVLVHRFRSVAAHQGAYMLPEMAVIEDVLRALGALVPEEEEEQ